MTSNSTQSLSLYSAQVGLTQNDLVLRKERKRLNRGFTKFGQDLYDWVMHDLGYIDSGATSTTSSPGPSRKNSFQAVVPNKGSDGRINEQEALKAHQLETERYGREFRAQLDSARRATRTQTAGHPDQTVPPSLQYAQTTVNPRDLMQSRYAPAWETSNVVRSSSFRAANAGPPPAHAAHYSGTSSSSMTPQITQPFAQTIPSWQPGRTSGFTAVNAVPQAMYTTRYGYSPAPTTTHNVPPSKPGQASGIAKAQRQKKAEKVGWRKLLFSVGKILG